MPLPKILIVGGGFAGLRAVRALKNTAADITLIDKRNFHLFQPLLYQVATGALSPANIASPLRHIVKQQKNVKVILGEVRDVEVREQKILADTEWLTYDYLIMATGASHHYFGHTEWENFAPGLKTLEDATQIRQRLLTTLEHAERSTNAEEIKRLLTFVVVGAGPTGVEMAGAFAEITKDTLKGNFRNIKPEQAHVLLVEATPRLLPTYTEDLSQKALEALKQLGVDVRLQTSVENISDTQVELRKGETRETIATQNIVWAAGVKASSLAKLLAEKTDATLDKAGRIIVREDLSLANFPMIFVLGDMAHYLWQDKPLPGVAPVAMQQGTFVGELITAKLKHEVLPEFNYRDLGSMATIGRARAIADIRGLRFTGLFAWLAWLFVHLMQLIGFENKLLVMLQWAWNYFSHSRSARLITKPKD